MNVNQNLIGIYLAGANADDGLKALAEAVVEKRYRACFRNAQHFKADQLEPFGVVVIACPPSRAAAILEAYEAVDAEIELFTLPEFAEFVGADPADFPEPTDPDPEALDEPTPPDPGAGAGPEAGNVPVGGAAPQPQGPGTPHPGSDGGGGATGGEAGGATTGNVTIPAGGGPPIHHEPGSGPENPGASGGGPTPGEGQDGGGTPDPGAAG